MPAAANQTRLFATLLFSGPVSYLRCLPNLCPWPAEGAKQKQRATLGTSKHRISMYERVLRVRAFKVDFLPVGRFEDEKKTRKNHNPIPGVRLYPDPSTVELNTFTIQM